jgi:hypothetical protein
MATAAHEHAPAPMLSEVGFLDFAERYNGGSLFNNMSPKEMLSQHHIESVIHDVLDAYINTLSPDTMVERVAQHIGASAVDLRASFATQPAPSTPVASDTLVWVNPDYRTLNLTEPKRRSFVPDGDELRGAVASRQGWLVDASARRGGIMSFFRWFNIFTSSLSMSLRGPRAQLRPEPVAATDVMTWVHFDFGIPVFVRYSGFGVGLAYAALMVKDKDRKVRLRYLVNKMMPWGPNAREPFSAGAWAVPEIMVIRMAIAVQSILLEADLDRVQYVTNEGKSYSISYMELRTRKGRAWNFARLGLVLQYPTALAAQFKTQLTVEPMEEDVGMNDAERIARDSVRTPVNVRNTPGYAIMPAGSTTLNAPATSVETAQDGSQQVVLTIDNDDGTVTEGGNAEEVD